MLMYMYVHWSEAPQLMQVISILPDIQCTAALGKWHTLLQTLTPLAHTPTIMVPLLAGLLYTWYMYIHAHVRIYMYVYAYTCRHTCMYTQSRCILNLHSFVGVFCNANHIVVEWDPVQT